MKTRNALVSNSSSASFVIIWRHWDRERDKEENLLDETLDRLFCDKQLKEYIKDHTKANEFNNAFISEFFTSMYNDMTDFSEAALLLTALENARDDKYEILFKRIESDG